MRVKELAELAGTTVRTVRHYHHVGLLDVPASTGGARDYELDHLARLLRIRWLAGAGLGLGAVRELLVRDAGAAARDRLADLWATRRSIEDQLADLRRRHERVVALIERAENDGSLTPLPARLSQMYERLEVRMPTARARLALEAERRIVSILAVRGLLPPAVDDLMASLTPEDDDAIVALFAEFGEFGARPGSEAQLDGRLDGQLDRQLDGHIAAWMAFTDRHQDQIADVLAQISGRQTAVLGLTARLIRLAYPSRAHARVVERYVAEAQKMPSLMAALNRSEP